MISHDKEWFKNVGASKEAIKELKEAVPVELPKNFYNLLEFSNGGEGPLSIEPGNFVLDSAEEIVKNIKAKTFNEFFPGFIVFGGNGGGEIIAFDTRVKSQLPVVMIDDTNIDLNESVVKITDNFNTFLECIGEEIENA